MEPLLSFSPMCMCLYEQLVVLFHHHQCEECEETDNKMQYIALPLCRSMEAMLSHIKYCRAGMSCQIPSCRDSRTIVSHGRACRKNDCPVALNLSTERTEWTQKLSQQIGRCSSNSEIHGLEVGKARRLLFVLFHIRTSTMLSNKPKSLCTLPQGHAVLRLLAHSRLCTELTHCLYPWCRSLRLLLQHCGTCMGNACMICHPLQTLVKQLYLRNQIHTFGLQNLVMIAQRINSLLHNSPRAPSRSATGLQDASVRTRSSPTRSWKDKSKKSWRSWKRCEGLWIRSHPYRNLKCKSRPAQRQQQTREDPSEIPPGL